MNTNLNTTTCNLLNTRVILTTEQIQYVIYRLSPGTSLYVQLITECSQHRNDWEQKWTTLHHKLPLFFCTPEEDSQKEVGDENDDMISQVSS